MKAAGECGVVVLPKHRDGTICRTNGDTFATKLQSRGGAAKILIDPFLSDNPSWDMGWIGSRAGEDSTQGGVR
jgi:hypothetical protein